VGSKYEDQIDRFWYCFSIIFYHVYVYMSWHQLLTVGFVFPFLSSILQDLMCYICAYILNLINHSLVNYIIHCE